MVLARLAVRNALNGSPGTGVLCRGPRRAKAEAGWRLPGKQAAVKGRGLLRGASVGLRWVVMGGRW